MDKNSIVYTVGHAKSYSLYLKDPKNTHIKLGRKPDYPGGSVWRTRAEAQRHCDEEFEVYGVRADWETQTVPNPEGDWHDLLVDAEFFEIED